ncbi:MAG: WecB/TagA/CpsF family glycosyltransferase [Verrucomicrobiae bacterium]|nr:WecB/TagA/CpsF family glycosyltransferase [Verrucomicrobiae bacterium]
MSDCCHILGTKVSLVQIPDVVAALDSWIAQRRNLGPAAYVVTTNVYGVMMAQQTPAHRRAINRADLAVPDGMPLVWIARARGARHMQRRVYGPELFEAACEAGRRRGWRFYFYGGAEGVAQRLAALVRERYPGVQVVGAETPPFRPLTPDEDAEVCRRINAARPDVVWVGLGGPKQDLWMADHAPKLNVPALIGIGAAFDFFPGRVSQAPRWMREHGLEWLYRLWAEPRRLWRRYLIYNPWFAWLLLLETLGLKKFPRE